MDSPGQPERLIKAVRAGSPRSWPSLVESTDSPGVTSEVAEAGLTPTACYIPVTLEAWLCRALGSEASQREAGGEDGPGPGPRSPAAPLGLARQPQLPGLRAPAAVPGFAVLFALLLRIRVKGAPGPGSSVLGSCRNRERSGCAKEQMLKGANECARDCASRGAESARPQLPQRCRRASPAVSAALGTESSRVSPRSGFCGLRSPTHYPAPSSHTTSLRASTSLVSPKPAPRGQERPGGRLGRPGDRSQSPPPALLQGPVAGAGFSPRPTAQS